MNELKELLITLTKIPAPSGKEDKRAEFCLNWFKKFGVEAYEDAAKNVIVPIGDKNACGQTVFLAHTDLVFPDETELPYSEHDGKLFSPGIGDNTVHVAELMIAARDLLKDRSKIKQNALVVFNSCEEGLGNLKGIKEIMKSFEGKIAAVISFDGTYNHIVTKCVGSERYRVTVKTEGGHSFGAFGNSNAIEKAADFIKEFYETEIPHDGDSKTTLNVGTITGGTSVNTIAQYAELLCEYRSDSDECIEYMRNRFESLIASRREKGIDISAELIGVRPCGKGVSKEALSSLTKRCVSICEKITGIPCHERSGSTDSNIPMSLGVPSVTVGGYLGGGAHTREEWLEEKSIYTGLEIVKSVLDEFIGG